MADSWKTEARVKEVSSGDKGNKKAKDTQLMIDVTFLQLHSTKQRDKTLINQMQFSHQLSAWPPAKEHSMSFVNHPGPLTRDASLTTIQRF